MERLTEKHYLAEDHYMKCSGTCHGDMDCIDCPAFDQLVERLAAYEDTGLEPEAVETVKLALAAKHLVDLETLNNTPISRLVELAEADKDGRCVVLPCKVGDTVWFTRSVFRQAAEPIEAVVLCAANHGGAGLTYTTRTVNGGLQRKFTSGQIGKTVFLTRCRCGRGYADDHPVRKADAEENGRGQNNGGIRNPGGSDGSE